MYIVNNLVEFRPNEKSLTNLITGQKVSLQLPATLCLLYLLNHKGEIIPQRTLIKEGWGKYEGITIPNTFYQTVLTLRKALEEVGLPRDIIKTLSRRGLIIEETTTVEQITPTVINNSDLLIDASKEANVIQAPEQSKRVISKITALTVVFFLLAIFNCIVLYQNKLTMPFQNFILLPLHAKLYKKCKIYYEPTEGTADLYINFIRQHIGFCTENAYIFMTGNSNSDRIVSFVCNKDARRDLTSFCSTNYYWNRSK